MNTHGAFRESERETDRYGADGKHVTALYSDSLAKTLRSGLVMQSCEAPANCTYY